MAETSQFEKALSELTEAQRRAVEWTDGPLLVLAGPGSGKTRVLTCRVARLLEGNRDNATRVLGLTFTNKAADEMRSRVEAFAPGMSNRLFLGTFHSFCADVLRQQGAHVGVRPDFRIYGSLQDLEKVIHDAVLRLAKERPDVRERDVSFLPVIQRLKGDLISPKEAPANVPEGELRDRIAFVYQAYEDELQTLNALDFNSLLYRACELFKKFPALAKRFRSVYASWCIDEFQDTNRAQFQLISLFAGTEFKDIFIVADDDQIIYQWNGASYRRFEELRERFHPEMIQLPTNYRCPPQIVEIANRLIRHNVLRTASKKPLEAARSREGTGKVIGVLHADDEMAEAERIAQIVHREYSATLSDVVVLARNRRLLELTKEAFSNLKVKSMIAQRKDDFSSAQLTWLHCSLKLAARPRDSAVVRAMASAFFKLTGTEIEVADVIARADTTNGNYFAQWLSEVIQTVRDPAVRNVCIVCRDELVVAHEYDSFVNAALTWLDSLDSSRDEEYLEEREAWNEIVSDVRRALGTHAALDAFLHELELRSKSATPGKNCVALMTIHGAKGKEFDYVFLLGMAEDIMPSFYAKRKGPSSSEMEEERRNCFVAVTRAKTRLVLSFADKYFGYSKNPSRFLTEMGLEKYTVKQ